MNKHNGVVEMTKLKVWLVERGIKQTWLVEKTGLHSTWINKIVNGKGTPNIHDAMKIARVLNATVEELWPLAEEDKPTH